MKIDHLNWNQLIDILEDYHELSELEEYDTRELRKQLLFDIEEGIISESSMAKFLL